MKKNDVFTFTAPNGVEVTAVVIEELHVAPLKSNDVRLHTFLCYAQNRLFTYYWLEGHDHFVSCSDVDEQNYGRIIVDYAILPDYDDMLEAEQQMFDDDCYEALGSIGNMEF